MEGWEPRGVLRELCLRAVCVVVKVAGVAWAGMWRAKKGAERRRKCDLRVFFVAKICPHVSRLPQSFAVTAKHSKGEGGRGESGKDRQEQQ